jgi:ssDNA thymidine ADP-ribosyltransferase, DarT
MAMPAQPKIYHIVHVDRLASIVEDGHLWCDAEVIRRLSPGTTVGMNAIKQRRIELPVKSHPGLKVGGCVPFYFCPRSVMLYLLMKGNAPGLAYSGGQEPILHLEADLGATVTWAKQNNRRWAFTLSNAGSDYFEDRRDLAQLSQIDWNAVQATTWHSCKEGKQAEFLVEFSFPWHLVDRVGVASAGLYQHVMNILPVEGPRPKVEVLSEWYY